ncbi:hypothetical protein AAVH_31678, partial [Aphelenchoides avenae]
TQIQTNDTLADAVWRFAQSVVDMEADGGYPYDIKQPLVRVRFDDDPRVKEVRLTIRLLDKRTAAMPDAPNGPREDGELYLLSQLFTGHFGTLSSVAKDASDFNYDILTKQVRQLNALFRLSYRQLSEMQLTNEE